VTVTRLTADAYPGLFCAAGKASASAQKTSLILSRTNLALLVAGAAFAAVSSAWQATSGLFAILSAISVALSLLISIYLKILAPEHVWYGGRAIAESVKSMAWRYMMGAEPYFVDLALPEVERKFVADLKAIFKERQRLAFNLGGQFAEQPQISTTMRTLRLLTLAERRSAYVADRIVDQKHWYGRQAKSNRESSVTYFYLVTISQILALVAAFALITHPESKLKLTGLFTSLAGALLTWVQIKQHKELAQAYSVAEFELGLIQEQAQSVATDQEFSDFVGDAENAISREHTLWIARRDKT
jgi:hypothetical protein